MSGHRGDRGPLFRVVGCLVAPLFVLAPLGLAFGVAWVGMRSTHGASAAAQELGLVEGPPHGWDGWYLGEVQGTPIAFAATYRVGSGGVSDPRGARASPTFELLVDVDDALGRPEVGRLRGARAEVLPRADVLDGMVVRVILEGGEGDAATVEAMVERVVALPRAGE